MPGYGSYFSQDNVKSLYDFFHTVFPYSVSHGVLNKRPMVRIVVKYQGGGISSSPDTLVHFPLNVPLWVIM
jgi:hypothetical protein